MTTFLRALVISALAAGVVAACGGSDSSPVAATAPHGWERLPAWPLGERNGVTAAWTGDEVVAVGGAKYACPPGTVCAVRDDEMAYRDGAALDPDDGTWHAIADAPVPVLNGSAAVVDGAMYVFAQTDAGGSTYTFLRYRPDADEWNSLPSPWKPGMPRYDLVGVSGTVVAVAAGSDEDSAPDFAFDTVAGTWKELPAGPLDSGGDRHAVAAGSDVYVFSNSAEGGVLHGARLDVAHHTWERLPDSPSPGWDPTGLLVDHGRIVSPASGCGSASGGIFDIDAQRWQTLPPTGQSCDPLEPPAVAGALGATSAAYVGPQGRLFDATSSTWRALPRLDDPLTSLPVVVAAGRDAVVLGRPSWIWSPG